MPFFFRRESLCKGERPAGKSLLRQWLPQDKNTEIRRIAGNFLDVIMDVSEQWAQRIKLRKFETYNEVRRLTFGRAAATPLATILATIFAARASALSSPTHPPARFHNQSLAKHTLNPLTHQPAQEWMRSIEDDEQLEAYEYGQEEYEMSAMERLGHQEEMFQSMGRWDDDPSMMGARPSSPPEPLFGAYL